MCTDEGFLKSWWKQPLKVIQHWTEKRYGTSFDFIQILSLYHLLRKQDIIVTTCDRCGLVLALFKRLKILNVPQIYITMGLIDRLQEVRSTNEPPIVLKSIFSCVDRFISYTEEERALLIRYFGLLPEKIQFFPFSIDTNYFHPLNISQEDFILSIGKDPYRDFQLLIDAVKNSKVQTLIVTTPNLVKPLSLYTRIPSKMCTLHELYSKPLT